MNIAVYAGHGGSDPGAVYNGLQEKDVTLAVSKALMEILEADGYGVLTNRTEDTDRDIQQDADMANEAGADAVLELHMNANEGTPYSGTEVFYSIHGGTGRILAEAIVRQIADLGYPDLGAKTRVNEEGEDYFGIIRLTRAPAVLVEMAFLNNPEDMARFDVVQMAQAIARGTQLVLPVNRAPVAEPNWNIQLGDKGDAARWVQWYLEALGYYLGAGGMDGDFGPASAMALKAFQSDYGLEVDGMAGPATRYMLKLALLQRVGTAWAY